MKDSEDNLKVSANPLRLFILRHGETEWSLSGQFSGRADVPLTENGRREARQLGMRMRELEFSHVLMSPLQRARETCELAGLGMQATVEGDLIEWDNGDYEGRTAETVLAAHPGWNLFRDGCPRGEMPWQVSRRADHLIGTLKKLDGNVALFTHGHLGRVLGARWIGISIQFAQSFLLDTASLSILSYQHNEADKPAITLWNSTGREVFDNSLVSARSETQADSTLARKRAIERWENEGGGTQKDSGSAQLAARRSVTSPPKTLGIWRPSK